jgi:hypothetical protein
MNKVILFLLDDDAHKVGLTYTKKRSLFYRVGSDSNYGKAEYPAETGNVIIFPSMMFHETGKNTKDTTKTIYFRRYYAHYERRC